MSERWIPDVQVHRSRLDRDVWVPRAPLAELDMQLFLQAGPLDKVKAYVESHVRRQGVEFNHPVRASRWVQRGEDFWLIEIQED